MKKLLFVLGIGIILTLVAVGAGLTIVSDDQTLYYNPETSTWQNAVATYVHPNWNSVPGATWIWRTSETNPQSEYGNIRTFQRTFSLPSDAYDISGSIQINADNAYELYVNGLFIGGEGAMSKDGPDYHEWATVQTFPVSNLVPGNNTIKIKALNYFNTGDRYSNPAGIIFRADVDYKQPLGINIDIKPGSFPNSINLGNNGNIPVGVLGSATFDATKIDRSTVVFAGAAPLSIGKSPQDVNGDGYLDVVFHFSTQNLALTLQAGDTSAVLTGKTISGQSFYGSDSVRIITK